MVETSPRKDVELEWLTQDLSRLKQDGLDKQLEAIFGKEEADQFLNPTIQEKPEKGTVHHFAKKSSGVHDAHSLWHSLRANSKRKLLDNTQNLEDFHGHSVLKRDGVLNKVEEYKHQYELMHRIAQLNEAKTKQLIQHVKLPKLTGEFAIKSGPQEYCVHEQSTSAADCTVLPEINMHTISSEKERCQEENIKSRGKSAPVKVNEKLVSFLSEEDCKYSGKFQERMKLLGIGSNIGISRPDLVYISSHKNTNSEPSEKSFNRVQFRDENRRTLDKTQKSKQHVEKSKWQPLTINALVEYTKSVPTSGSGEFRSGKGSIWRPA